MAEPKTVPEKLTAFINAIKTLMDMIESSQTLDSANSTLTFEQSHHNFFAAAKILKSNITKFNIGVKDAEKLDEMAGLADMIEKDCTNLVWATQALIVIMKAHKSISKKLLSSVHDCLEAVLELGDAMLNKKYEGNNVNRLTGVVWKCCDEIDSSILDPKAAMSHDIKGHMGTIKDALEELEEAAAAEDDDNDGGDDEDDDFGDDFGDDMDDDFGDFKDQKLSRDDKKVVPGCSLVLKTCGSICSQVIKYLAAVALPPLAEIHTDAAQQTIGWMAVLYERVAELADLADELVQSVYPPQKRDVVLQACQKIRDAMASILAQLKNSEGRIDATAVDTLEKTINAFMDKATDMLK